MDSGLSNRCVSAKYKADAIILVLRDRHQMSQEIPFQETQTLTPVTCFFL